MVAGRGWAGKEVEAAVAAKRAYNGWTRGNGSFRGGRDATPPRAYGGSSGTLRDPPQRSRHSRHNSHAAAAGSGMGRRMCSAPPARGALRHQGVAAVATGVKRTGAVMACQRVGVAAKARGGGSDGGSDGLKPTQLVAAAGVSSVAVSSMCRAAAPSASYRAATGRFVWPLPAASSPAQQRLWSEDRQAGA